MRELWVNATREIEERKKMLAAGVGGEGRNIAYSACHVCMCACAIERNANAGAGAEAGAGSAHLIALCEQVDTVQAALTQPLAGLVRVAAAAAAAALATAARPRQRRRGRGRGRAGGPQPLRARVAFGSADPARAKGQ